MASTPEGKVKKAIDRMLDKFNAFSYAPTTGGYGKSGFFDRLAVLNSVPIGIEAKATAKDMPTRLQTQNATEFYHAGGAVLCIHKDNLDSLFNYLRHVEDNGADSMRVFDWPAKAISDFKQQEDK